MEQRLPEAIEEAVLRRIAHEYVTGLIASIDRALAMARLTPDRDGTTLVPAPTQQRG